MSTYHSCERQGPNCKGQFLTAPGLRGERQCEVCRKEFGPLKFTRGYTVEELAEMRKQAIWERVTQEVTAWANPLTEQVQ